MASLKGNIILNYINTITGLIFPVVTFPYAARVLQPEGIGVVNFQNSIISYIVLLTSLGIPLYAVREIAKCRDDIELRDRTTVEITILSVVLCLFGYVAVYLLGQFVPRISEDLNLFYVLSLTIIFTGIGVNWFYQGIEDFLFITVRGLIVRLLCAVSLFVFVKDKDDLILYALIIVGSTVGNNLINFIHLRKYVQFSRIKWQKLDIARHVKPAFHVFLLNVIISFYIQLNTIMLGFMTDDRAVGLFTSGIKLTHIMAVIMASLSTVMLPHCSYLIGESQYEKFDSIIRKTYHLLMLSAIPLTAGIMFLSGPAMLCFCGYDYYDSIPVVLYTAPTIIFASLSNIIGFQILYPYGKENLFIISTLIASIFNAILNILLIPYFEVVGASISTLLTELLVLVLLLQFGKSYIPFKLIDKKIVIYFLATLIMVVTILPYYIINNIWCQLLYASLVGGLVYLMVLYFFKDYLLIELLATIRAKFM